MHTLCLAQFAVQLDNTYTHSWCTHCAKISCTAVHLYFSPVSVQSGTVYTPVLYNSTLASANLASVFSTNHRRFWFPCSALIGPLGVQPSGTELWHVNTALLPCRTGCVKLSFRTLCCCCLLPIMLYLAGYSTYPSQSELLLFRDSGRGPKNVHYYHEWLGRTCPDTSICVSGFLSAKQALHIEISGAHSLTDL